MSNKFAMGIYRRLLLLAFPEKAVRNRARIKRWCKLNPTKVANYTRAYKARNRASFLAKHRAAQKSWRSEHVEESRRRSRQYYHAHPEHRERRQARDRLWYLNNRDQVYQKHRRRTALQKSVTVGNLAEIAKVYARAKELRQWFDVDVDHIIPMSRGGAHSAENLQIIYAKENSQKNNRLDYVPTVVFR